MPAATDLRIDIENSPGHLAAIGEALGEVGVNIEGFCAIGGRGCLHVLVENPRTAHQALEDAGFTVAAERAAVVLPGVENRPGYLGELARRLADAGINIEAAYLATHTRIVFAVDDVEGAWQAL